MGKDDKQSLDPIYEGDNELVCDFKQQSQPFESHITNEDLNIEPTDKIDHLNIDLARKRGKRAIVLNPDISQINAIFTKLWDDVEGIISSNQKGKSGRTQSDVKNKKIIRKIRKFAKTLLNLFCTENQRKGKSDEKMLEFYRRCFENGFLPLLTENQDNFEGNKVLLFSDFIKLSFPPKRAYNVLGIIANDSNNQNIAAIINFLI